MAKLDNVKNEIEKEALRQHDMRQLYKHKYRETNPALAQFMHEQDNYTVAIGRKYYGILGG